MTGLCYPCHNVGIRAGPSPWSSKPRDWVLHRDGGAKGASEDGDVKLGSCVSWESHSVKHVTQQMTKILLHRLHPYVSGHEVTTPGETSGPPKVKVRKRIPCYDCIREPRTVSNRDARIPVTSWPN
ncbi:hypothetical protein ACJJTC_012934 [Scirpophaga incertulas]